MTLFECVGNSLANRLITSHLLIVLLYWWIAIGRFVPAALSAHSKIAKRAWWSIAFLFPFCATGGYLTTVASGWMPTTAYFVKEWMAYLDIIACVVFLFATNRKQFEVIGEDEFKSEVAQLVGRGKPAEILRQIKERL